MSLRQTPILLGALAGLAVEPATAEASFPVKEVTWLVGDMVRVEPGAAPSRPADRLIAFLSERLPQVKQTSTQANASRSWQLIAQGGPYCAINAVRTPERERLAHFTNTGLMPPPQLIVRRDRIGQLPLDAAGHVDLAGLMALQTLRGALVQGRSFGPVIDALVQQRPPTSGVVGYSTGDFGSRILPMLAKDRADYAIEYDFALVLLGRTDPALAEILTTVPIQGAHKLLTVGIACPRTPQGLSFIRRVDAELSSPEGASLLRRQVEEPLTAETRRRYAAQIDTFFTVRAHPGKSF